MAGLHKISSKSTTVSSSPKLNQPSNQMSAVNIAKFFEPAVDQPPSAESLRQINKQMKRASHLQLENGHRAVASASSSLTSLNSESHRCEQALDSLSSVRRSSTRSIEGGAPSRDLLEGVYGFGKNMFHRKGASRPESTNSSSSSSMYSSNSPADNNPPGQKESFMPAIFSRRKASRGGTALKKLQISSPFNFQHVTHTNRETAPLKQDMSTMRAAGPGSTSVPSATKDLVSRDGSFSDANAELVNPLVAAPLVRPILVPRHTAPAPSGPQQLMRRVRSQDQLRGAPSLPSPPRPPRSPTHETKVQSLSLTPPRVSSRQGACHDGNEQSAAITLERPMTSGGFRRAQPYSPNGFAEHLQPVSIREPSTPTKHDGFFKSNGSRVHAEQPLPNEAAWPLASPAIASYESSLPDVPEEDEHCSATRRSRLSLASSLSSFRGSQSIPMSPSVAQLHRPMSGTSETLGNLELVAVQQSIVENSTDDRHINYGIIEASWEDDIDYCYEHEAEANCDYQWERCSLDAARDNTSLSVEMTMEASETQLPVRTTQWSSGMLSVAGFDMPALSPVSQASTANGHEAVTPTSNPPLASNFSLPFADKRNLCASYASSFNGSQGSPPPCLLVPGDFHQQLFLADGGRHVCSEDDKFMAPYHHQFAYDETAAHINNNSMQWFQQRSSMSTTETMSTSRSGSTEDRHGSTNSSWSFHTRHTTSSTSLNKMAGSWTEPAEPAPTTHLLDKVQTEAEQDAIFAAKQDMVPELIRLPSGPVKEASCHKTHASESVVHGDGLPSLTAFEAGQQLRLRARTASLSGQLPPVGQYALFPRSYIKPRGDRI